jgi:hypothetical protein
MSIGFWGQIAAAGCALALASGALAHEAKAGKQAKKGGVVSAHRLVVTDAAEAVVRVIDAETGKELARADLASPGRLTHERNGRHVYIWQGAAGQVRQIDTGVALEDHGDHLDIDVKRPRIHAGALTGAKPSHINFGDGRVVVFFDGDGAAKVVGEGDFAKANFAAAMTLRTERPHHGVAKPIGKAMAVSVPKEGENLPVAVELRGEGGREGAGQRIDCPRLHGEGAAGRFTAFGCADGLAIFEQTATGVTARKAPYAASLPAGRMVRNLNGAAGFSLLAGDFGPDGMVIIDPANPADMRFIQLPARRIHFALDRNDGAHLFVLVEDGRLLRFNALTGEAMGDVAVTGRYAMEAGVVRPRMAQAGAFVVVSDPAAGEVAVIEAATLKVARRIKAGGQPFDVALAGGRGETH